MVYFRKRDLRTNLLKPAAAAETVQTVEEREDVKHMEDADPLQSLRL